MPVDLSFPLVVDSLGKMQALGMRLSVSCYTYLCHKHTWIDMDELITRLGDHHSCMEVDLKPHYYCAKCRGAGKPDRNIGFTIHSNTPAPPTDTGMPPQAQCYAR